MSMLFNTYV